MFNGFHAHDLPRVTVTNEETKTKTKPKKTLEIKPPLFTRLADSSASFRGYTEKLDKKRVKQHCDLHAMLAHSEHWERRGPRPARNVSTF